MKCFPPIILSGYSSGTGMSGVLGATLYLIFKLCNVSFTKTVLSLLVFYPIYGLCFFLIIRMKLAMKSKTQQVLLEQSQLEEGFLPKEISEDEVKISLSSSPDIVVDHQENLEAVE